jgi:hypothetical protein
MAKRLSPSEGLEGLRFGRLVVKKRAERDLYDQFWLCACDCGKKKKIRGRAFTKRDRPTLSCGCLQKERASKARKTHGDSNSPEYKVWAGMWTRCTNPKQASFKDYGARGVTVCKRWEDYGKFLEDMGRRPTPKHTIDRADNNKGYSPNNCKWVPRKEQNRNKLNTILISYRGEKRLLNDWCELLKLPPSTIRMRLWRGWPVSDAFEFPITPGKWHKWHKR